MKMASSKTLAWCGLLLTLLGCSQLPPYRAPENGDVAYVKADFDPVFSRKEWIVVSATHDNRCKQYFARPEYAPLVDVDAKGPSTHEFIPVAGGRTLFLQVHGHTFDGSCQMFVHAVLKPGGRYLLQGGVNQPLWPGSEIRRGCKLNVRDADTGEPVQVFESHAGTCLP